MNLFIQIPCLNEEKTLPSVIASLPKKIDGIDKIYILLVDDGSTDKTVEVAQNLGIDYIIKNNSNLGLAATFCKGVDAGLFLGADIIVNVDGDNQYKAENISDLIKPILEKREDIVVGCRNINTNGDFSILKKILQIIGSKVVCHLAQIDIPDTTSGFRAMNCIAARKFVIRCKFSYTLEMLCQSRRIGLRIGWVPVGVNEKTRESRLFKSNFEYVFQQMKIIIVVLLEYYPLAFFSWTALVLFLISIGLGLINQLSPLFLNTERFSLGYLFFFSLASSILCIVAGLIGSVLSSLHLLLIDIRALLRTEGKNEETVFKSFDIIKSPDFFSWAKIKDKT
ncbi:MAG: glycosyltransferase family 2 protein [Candidatus Omnitrophica bacterium]|nr:glycosyltransferase family 2 protein [Candidatus Omnitrophota bacterium]